MINDSTEYSNGTVWWVRRNFPKSSVERRSLYNLDIQQMSLINVIILKTFAQIFSHNENVEQGSAKSGKI